MRKLLLLAGLTQLGATDCGGNVIRDDGFDLWCGDALCAWKVERGAIERAPTWHDNDPGVSFVGTDVAIEQLSPVTGADGTCITFSMIANVEPSADVFLNIDVQGDGSVERMERIPTASWQPVSFHIALTPPFDGVRFEIAKQGTGAAVLAQLTGTLDAGACSGIAPIASASPRRDGAACDADADCASGLCRSFAWATSSTSGKVCVGCEPGGCTGGLVCGAGEATSPILRIPAACVPAGSAELGEHCFFDQECATGICYGQTCSACAPDRAACPGGATCAASWPTVFGVFAAYVCGGGSGTVTAGEPCGADADCASGQCNGAEREQCGDGRACETAASCPVDDGLTPGSCTTVGVQGGSCQ